MRLLLISWACLSLVLLQSAGALAVHNRSSKAHNGKSGERKASAASSAKLERRQDKRHLFQLAYGLQHPQTIYGPPPAVVQPEVVHHPAPAAPAVFEHSEPLPAQPIALPLPVRPGIIPAHVVPVGPPAVDFGPIRFPAGAAVPIGPAALPVHVITRHIAVPVEVAKPYPVHVEKVVHVDRPVHVPKPYPVAYPVEKIIKVDRPFPVHVAVPVHVPKPYPVPVAVRTHYEPLARDW